MRNGMNGYETKLEFPEPNHPFKAVAFEAETDEMERGANVGREPFGSANEFNSPFLSAGEGEFESGADPSISASVGWGGVNLAGDVAQVQRLVNAHLPVPLQPLKEDGICGPATIFAIETFQRTNLGTNTPDGRVDPGGATFAALTGKSPASPPSAGQPKPSSGGAFTSNPNEQVTKTTTPTARQVVDLVLSNWSALTESGARTLAAQFMLETNRGKNCYNWNLGNVKAGANEPHMYLRNVWECFGQEQAQAQVDQGKGLARLPADEEIKKHGWKCASAVVVYSPPHSQCRFRAYASLQEGAQKWLGLHQRISQKNSSYVSSLNAGDTSAAAHVLKLAGYYTAAEASYSRLMAQMKTEVDQALGPIPAANEMEFVSPPVFRVAEPVSDADDARSLLGRRQPLALLHWLLAAGNPMQTMTGMLSPDARPQPVRIAGLQLSPPAYLRMIGRLCGEVAELYDREFVAGNNRETTEFTGFPGAGIAGEGETPVPEPIQFQNYLAKALLTSAGKLTPRGNLDVNVRSVHVPFYLAAVCVGAKTTYDASVYPDEMHFSASLLKVAALFAAAMLHAEATAFLSNGHATLHAYLSAFKTSLAARIKANADHRILSAGIGLEPNVEAILEITGFGSAGGPAVAFTKTYGDSLNSMIGLGTDGGAAQCIRALGYGYINTALKAQGLFDSPTSKGIWLAGTYAKGTGYVRIPCENDHPDAQVTTVRQMCRLFLMIRQNQIPAGDATANQVMQSLLSEPKPADSDGLRDVPWVERGRNVTPLFSVVLNKIGFAGLGSNERPLVYSEGLIIKWLDDTQIAAFNSKVDPDNSKPGARLTGEFAVCYQNLLRNQLSDAFDGIIEVINNSVSGFLQQTPP